MDKQKMVEAMARLDGYTMFDPPKEFEYGIALGERNGGYIRLLDLPNYLTSHDACQRVIDGFAKDQTLGTYVRKLQNVVGDGWVYELCTIATPAQKVEAILKATGEWEEE